jgi:GT2 family glycosyltransferase
MLAVPGLSLVVPATKTATLPQCLAEVEAAADGPDEVIVIDAPAEAGPAAARNIGARRAACELVAFLDADVLVRPDAFTRMRAAMEAPELTAVFGSYDDAPADPGWVSGFRNLLHHDVHQSAAGPATTFWSGLGAVRRAAFLSVGGYDEDRFEVPSVEDVDLGMRLSEAGGTIRLDPGLQGTHLKRWTLRSMIKTDFARRGLPWTRLLLKRRRSSTALNLGWRHRVSALASLATVGLAALGSLLALVALVAMVALNLSLFRAIHRSRGPAQAIAGVALLMVHHLAAAAALAAGVVVHARPRRKAAEASALRPSEARAGG